MARDFSWTRAGRQYEALLTELMYPSAKEAGQGTAGAVTKESEAAKVVVPAMAWGQPPLQQQSASAGAAAVGVAPPGAAPQQQAQPQLGGTQASRSKMHNKWMGMNS